MPVIRIVPLHFSGMENLREIRSRISSSFRCEVVITTVHMDLNPCFDPVRSQYNANPIIERLQGFARNHDKIIGVTDLDIFIPVLRYLFGQAYLGGSAALVSTYRLDDRRYGLKENPDGLKKRLLKCMLHELGHTFGLVHCTHVGCIMQASTYAEEIDQKTARFCKNCTAEIHHYTP